jgi:methylenetetrahydrofolate reductase (NADPH)
LGICNILFITGDHPRVGPAPKGRMDIWDVDAIQMIWIIRRMRDEGHFLDGREIKVTPHIFIGAAGSPFASTDRFQAIREEKKVNAGAQFFQTNLVYDVEGFERYLAALDKRGVLGRVFMLPGITPIRSLRAVQAIGSVAGVRMPRQIVERMEKSADPQEEGIQITLEIIDRVKRLPGVNGIHIMAIGWESIVPRLVTESSLRKEETPL